MKNERIPSALLMNDIHVSKDNIPEFQANWDEALAICQQSHIEDLVIGGDLWQSSSTQTLATLMAVRQAILKATSMGLRLTIAEGNHCKVDRESVLGYSHVFSAYPNVHVVDDYTFINIGKQTVLYVMSYFPENGSFKERLEALVQNELETEKYNVLYIHEGINGALATVNEKELPTNIFRDFDAVLVGHYHNRCKLPGTNIEYIGSSRQHNFGEDEIKGYTILYDDGSYEFVQNQANIRYRVVNYDCAELNDETLARIQTESAEGRVKIKASITCSPREATGIDKRKLMDAGITKIELVTEDQSVGASAVSGLERKYDKSGIIQEYVGFCTEKGIENVELGLKYLDKIN